MPVESFEVIVSQSGEKNESVAIAAASQYLAYCDQTGTFGYRGDVFDVNVYGGDGGQDYGIALFFTAPVENDDQLKRFMDEMVRLSHVESVERVYRKPIP
jgi:hypothetical protein